MTRGFPNPMTMADAFITAACPDQIFSIEEGTHNGRQLLAMERRTETKLVWLIRLFAYLLAVLSCNMIFSPLRYLLSYLWFIGWILNASIHLFACLCATSLRT